MIVMLHADDDTTYWLGNLLRHKKELEDRLQQPVEVLPRDSIERARSVIDGTDLEMRELSRQGHQLDAAILDLLMGGGIEQEVSAWLAGIKDLASSAPTSDGKQLTPAAIRYRLPEDKLDRIDGGCPSLRLGRRAADSGAIVVVLSSVGKFLKSGELDLEAERALLMAAAGASRYVAKTDPAWLDRLSEALVPLRAARQP